MESLLPAERVRIGIAGLGRMGRFHAENLAMHVPSAELVRVVDAAEDLARSTGEALGVGWALDVDALLEDPEIEAVAIVTPTPTHAELIERAAAAGKHVFCEKPVSLDERSSRRAIDAAATAGIKLQVGFHRRFDPDWSTARDRIAAGELGEVYLFRTSLRDMRSPPAQFLQTSGGFFVDVTIHDFDTARWMVGEIVEVSAFGAALSDPSFAELGDIDNAVVVLRFASGALGVIDNSRQAGYGYECSTEVMGSRATVRIGDHRRVHNEWLTPGAAIRDHVHDFVERYPEAYRLELEHFARAVRRDQPVRVSGEDSVAAFVLCTAARRSFETGRPVRLVHEEGADQVTYSLAGEAS